MRIVSHLLRKSYIDSLSGLTYLGQIIPINDEYLNLPEVILPVSSILKPKAHILVSSQTANNNEYKCADNEIHSIQIETVTTYNQSSGGFIHAELIADEIMKKLNTNILMSSNLNIWTSILQTNRNISEEHQTTRVYRKILVFENQVQQKFVTT